jgi:hypothetical protein
MKRQERKKIIAITGITVVATLTIDLIPPTITTRVRAERKIPEAIGGIPNVFWKFAVIELD